MKAKSDSLFKDLGTDTRTAIRMFLTQAVSANGFSSEILSHRYFMIYHLEENTVFVDEIFHELQDYEKVTS